MNLAILNSGRPHDGIDSGKRPPLPQGALQQFAVQNNMDLSEVQGQAENLWSMLDELHESDEEAYTAFLKNQMNTMNDSKESTRSFKPVRGFVVKASIQPGNGLPCRKLFINFCHHEAIERPKDGAGKFLNKDQWDDTHLRGFENLQIPLVVSKIRSAVDASDNEVSAVDVIFHPWCIATCTSPQSSLLKVELVKLGVQSVQVDCKIKIVEGWKVIKSKYKGGAGPNGNDIVPFIVDQNMMKPSESTVHESSSEPTHPLGAAKSKEGEGGQLKDIVSSPADVITGIKAGDLNQDLSSNETITTLVDGGVSRSVKCQKPLIKEIHSSSAQQLEGRNNEKKEDMSLTNAPKESKKIPLSKEMKGFLTRPQASKRKPLYEHGSSGDGFVGSGGAYASFLSKCQVVDMSKTKPEMQPQEAQEHLRNMTANFANSISSSSHTDKNQKEYDHRGAFKNLPNKGFLQSENKEDDLVGDGMFDVEFQKLVETADPEFASNFSDPHGADKDELDELSHMTKKLADMSHTLGDGGLSTSKSKPEEKNGLVDIHQLETESSTMAEAADLKSTVTPLDGKVIVEVDMRSRESTGDNIDLSGVELETSEHTLRLKLGTKVIFHHDFNAAVIEDCVQAKFTKNKILKIIAPLR